jgi:hypothetical protein
VISHSAVWPTDRGAAIDRLKVTSADHPLAPLDVAIPAALLPVGVLIATRASGGGVARAQVAFVLAGSAALLVDQCHLVILRRARTAMHPRRIDPIRAAGLAAAGCAALTAPLIPLSRGYIAESAGIAALADGLLAAGLLAPGLPDARGSARDVVWRLLMVAIAGAAIATSTVAWPLLAGAAVWWVISRITRPAATRDHAPTVAQLAAAVVPLSELASDPATERRRLDDVRFGVVSRGCEHRLVDAASQEVADLPADRRIDWWRISESVPVVNGAMPITLIEPALDAHTRVLVQVGDVVTGVLVRAEKLDPSATGTSTNRGSIP